MGNRNSRDTRPVRAKQKERSTKNKIKQLKAHITNNPEDKNAEKKLIHAQSGKSRFRVGVHPTEQIIQHYAGGKVKRDKKR